VPLAELALQSPEERRRKRQAAAEAAAAEAAEAAAAEAAPQRQTNATAGAGQRVQATGEAETEATGEARRVGALRAAVALLDPGPVIELGVTCSLSQLLDHGYFHGDPHPGTTQVPAPLRWLRRHIRVWRRARALKWYSGVFWEPLFPLFVCVLLCFAVAVVGWLGGPPGNLMVTASGQLAYLDFGMMGVLDRRTRVDSVKRHTRIFHPCHLFCLQSHPRPPTERLS
jgi:hypothetical protein